MVCCYHDTRDMQDIPKLLDKKGDGEEPVKYSTLEDLIKTADGSAVKIPDKKPEKIPYDPKTYERDLVPAWPY